MYRLNNADDMDILNSNYYLHSARLEAKNVISEIINFHMSYD